MTLINCRQAVARMWAYLSDGLEKRDVAELESHLGVCERCCGELEFSRQLRGRIAEADVNRVPGPVRERIVELLNRHAGSPGEQ